MIHDLLIFAYFMSGAPVVTIAPLSETLPPESTVQTAIILPFRPRPKNVAPNIMPHSAPEDRLARAVAGLSQALAEQRAAVTAWRDALGTLKTSTAGLQKSLTRYQGKLQTLSDSVATLRTQAQSLGEWADNVTAPKA
jgi:uncharacterized coiled-coil protein SlyX